LFEIVLKALAKATKLNDQGSKKFIIKKLLLIIGICIPVTSEANFTCSGRFVNPITDICWSCLMPISIGSVKLASGSGAKNRDTKNPASPLCICNRNQIPIPGVAVGFWEPARLVDVTRTPFCMTNLGGLQISSSDMTKISSYQRGYGKHIAHRSFYHLHYYIYPFRYLGI